MLRWDLCIPEYLDLGLAHRSTKCWASGRSKKTIAGSPVSLPPETVTMGAIQRVLAVWLLALLHVTVASPGFEQKCLAFKPGNRTIGARLNVLQYVAAGTNLTFPDNDVSCARASQKVYVDLCRITLEIPTSRTSNISFEAWFPENWSGRFLATGNGGIDGCKYSTSESAKDGTITD